MDKFGMPPSQRGKSRATPAARILAAEKDIDLATLHGSGPDNIIVVADVERAIRRSKEELKNDTEK